MKNTGSKILDLAAAGGFYQWRARSAARNRHADHLQENALKRVRAAPMWRLEWFGRNHAIATRRLDRGRLA
jgi:hypothetical protein